MSRLEPAHTELERPAQFPFTGAGTAAELFPPLCLKSHWDPTAMLRLIVPNQHIELPLDFRPYVKVCKEYRTSAVATEAPAPPPGVVIPITGGTSSYTMPPTGYSEHIDAESKLRYLDRRLNRWCQLDEWVPSTRTSDMMVPGILVPEDPVHRLPKAASDGAGPILYELEMPQAILREGPYDCRAQEDVLNWSENQQLFNNPTKQQKYSETQVHGYFPMERPGAPTYARPGNIRPEVVQGPAPQSTQVPGLGDPPVGAGAGPAAGKGLIAARPSHPGSARGLLSRNYLNYPTPPGVARIPLPQGIAGGRKPSNPLPVWCGVGGNVGNSAPA